MRLGWLSVIVVVALVLPLRAQEGADPQVRGLLEQAAASEALFRDQEAQAALDLALKLDPDNAQAKESKARLAKYQQLDTLTSMAEAGEIGAMVRLGDRAVDGKDSKPKKDKALEWYQKAAEKGSPDALYRVGLLIDKENLEDAAACFKAAAEAGQRQAMLEYGRRCLRGAGVPRNLQEAMRWIQQAADKGDEWAMLDLASANDAGLGGARNRAVADRLREQVEKRFSDRIRQIPTSTQAYHELALFYSRTRRPEQAIQALRRGVDATGGDSNLRIDLVDLLIQTRNFDEAQVQAEAELRIHPRNNRMRDLLLFSKVTMGDYAAASAEADAALKNDANDVFALTQRGWLRLQRGDAKGAVEDYRKVLQIEPENAQTYEYLGEALTRSGDLDAAVEAFGKSLQLEPARRTARLLLVEVQTRRKNWSAVDQLLQQAQTDPATAGEPVWLRVHARSYLARQQRAAAVGCVEKMLKLKGNNWDDVAELLDQIHETPGGAADAMRLGDEAMKDLLASHTWSIRLVRGVMLAGRKENANALMEFDAAMTAADVAGNDLAAERIGYRLATSMGSAIAIERLSARRQVRWLVPLMTAYRLNGNHAKAASTADELIASVATLSPGAQIRAWETAAQAWQKQGESDPAAFSKSENAYRRCLALVEETPLVEAKLSALNNLAWLLVTRPQADAPAALQYSTRAIKLMKENGLVYEALLDTHGWCLVVSGKIDEGISYLEQALAKDSSAAESHYHLAEAYLKKKMPKEALDHIVQAKAVIRKLEKTPDAVDPDVLRKLPDAESRARAMLDAAKPKPADDEDEL